MDRLLFLFSQTYKLIIKILYSSHLLLLYNVFPYEQKVLGHRLAAVGLRTAVHKPTAADVGHRTLFVYWVSSTCLLSIIRYVMEVFSPLYVTFHFNCMCVYGGFVIFVMQGIHLL